MDERLHSSPVRAGWIERTHFTDATAALWLEGELVQVEDLVLHDERMDVRAPTHELTRAHTILRARRRIFSTTPGWALSEAGLRELAGLGTAIDESRGGEPQSKRAPIPADAEDADLEQAEEDPLAEQFAALDAVLERTTQLLEGKVLPKRTSEPTMERERPSIVYDLDWDEDARMAEWTAVLEQTQDLPAMLRAAIMLDAWGQIEVLQHGGWLGGLFVAALLRREGLRSGRWR